jgi:hypothetical protein
MLRTGIQDASYATALGAFAMLRFRFSITSLFVLQAAVLFVFIITSWLGILQLHYPRVIDNDPLLSPVKVLSVSGNTLLLEDGRTLLVTANREPLGEVVQKSAFRVDVESEGDGVLLYAKHRGWLCGTPWVGLIEIPLIADDVPINRREFIGLARVAVRSVDDDM